MLSFVFKHDYTRAGNTNVICMLSFVFKHDYTRAGNASHVQHKL